MLVPEGCGLGRNGVILGRGVDRYIGRAYGHPQEGNGPNRKWRPTQITDRNSVIGPADVRPRAIEGASIKYVPGGDSGCRITSRFWYHSVLVNLQIQIRNEAAGSYG